MSHESSLQEYISAVQAEFASLRSRCERMEGFMAKVAKRLDLEYSPT